MKPRPLSSETVAAHPQLYRAYRALELALHSGSDSDLVKSLNVYIDTAHKQGFLTDTATVLRNNLSQRLIAEERRLSRQSRESTTTASTGTPPASL
jgi:hypothetical protein